ncbi:MAG: DUF624 domain-containing protein [Lachnospiraceae bacterium]|nr:DUF624 domain-containing protein [Lachnospiraceae bacterium]
MRIFDDEGLFMRILSRLADLLWINVLTLICCIPVFTVGASLTAMHYVLLKMVRNEEGYLTRSFFGSFRRNFRQATLIWLLLMLFFGVCIVDLHYFEITGVPLPVVFQLLLVMIAFLVLCIASMVFALLAKFENTVISTIKNALLFSMGQFPRILLMLLMAVFPVILLLWTTKMFPVVLLFGISLPGYGAAQLYNKPFARLEERMERKDDL